MPQDAKQNIINNYESKGGESARNKSERKQWVDLVGGCSPEHFPLAHSPRLAASIRRRLSRVRLVRSFAHLSTLLSLLSLSFGLSLRYAQLCSATLALARLLISHLCCSSRASPSASSLLVPRISSLLGSTPRFNLTLKLNTKKRIFNDIKLKYCNLSAISNYFSLKEKICYSSQLLIFE